MRRCPIRGRASTPLVHGSDLCRAERINNINDVIYTATCLVIKVDETTRTKSNSSISSLDRLSWPVSRSGSDPMVVIAFVPRTPEEYSIHLPHSVPYYSIAVLLYIPCNYQWLTCCTVLLSTVPSCMAPFPIPASYWIEIVVFVDLGFGAPRARAGYSFEAPRHVGQV